MKLLRTFGVAVAVSGVMGATMLASGPSQDFADRGAQQADIRAVAALPPPGDGDTKTILQVESVTRIAKMGSAVSLGPGTFRALIKEVAGDEPNPLIGELTMPAAEGYFVVFRFMPVTNKTSFTQVGDATGTINLAGTPVTTEVKIKLTLGVSEVRQNGVLVDVGPNCRTVSPIDVELKGEINLGKKAVTPGQPIKEEDRAATMHSTYTIPPFTGCGVGENLSPLLTGLVSGPGNELITYLGKICYISCSKFWP